MWIEFTKKTELAGRTYNVGRRAFFSERNAETLINAKKAKEVVEDVSGPATVRAAAKPKPKAKAKTEK